MKDVFKGCSAKTLNGELGWLHEPPQWEFKESALWITPAADTDLFRPYRGDPRENVGLLYTKVKGDFSALARVEATLQSFADAAALTVFADQKQWMKLCVERSPIGDISIVTVVTNEWSDDSNNELLQSAKAFLRITRKGDVFGMHYSLDGTTWRFVRTVGLPLPEEVMVGVHAQAPYAGGCRVIVREFSIGRETVEDFRSGL